AEHVRLTRVVSGTASYTGMRAAGAMPRTWSAGGMLQVQSTQQTLTLTEEATTMDILVMLEENPEHSPVLAHVNSVPSPLDVERRSRDIVTIYGAASAESLALALAAA